MTEIDTSTAAVAALMDGVTPGPWVVYGEPEVGIEDGLFSGEIGKFGFGPLEPLRGFDLSFVAASRELVPALAAENAALREDNERLRAALEIATSRADQWADDDDLSDWAKPARIIAADIESALKGGANG